MECMRECQKGCKDLEVEQHCIIQLIRTEHQDFVHRSDREGLGQSEKNKDLESAIQDCKSSGQHILILSSNYIRNKNPMMIGWLNSYVVEPLTR